MGPRVDQVPPQQIRRAATAEQRQNALNNLEPLNVDVVTGTPEQEQQARAAGFKNYDQMRVYLIQKSRKTGGSQPTGGDLGARDSGSSRRNSLSWHPQQLLNYVQRKWDEAMGGGQ